MNRLFQDNSGDIACFTDSRFKQVKAVVDAHTGNILVLWMKPKGRPFWYRVFIDGHYCGVDAYEEDLSRNDLDEGIFITDLTTSFIGLIFRKGRVKLTEGDIPCIILSLAFEGGCHCLVYDLKTDLCSFVSTPK